MFGINPLDTPENMFYYLINLANGVTHMSPHENERLRLKAEVLKAMGHPLSPRSY